MRMRTIVFLAALFAVALWAVPAQARIVYVKNPGGVQPIVYVGDRQGQGSAPHRHRPRADDLPGRAVGRVRDRPGRAARG